MGPKEYDFSEDWFTWNLTEWDRIIPRLKPKMLLEFGSYEGRSTCYFIERFAAENPIELHCIDTWEGGQEHTASEMPTVEARFDNNVAKAQCVAGASAKVVKHKQRSNVALLELAAENVTAINFGGWISLGEGQRNETHTCADINQRAISCRI